MFHNSTIVLLEITAAISIGLIAYFKWNLTHWQRLGIPTLNPTIPFGDSKKLFYGHYSLGEQFQQFYRYFRSKGHRHGGAYLGVKPYYIPIDLDIIKHILLTDFDHFTTRGLYMDEKNDPLSANLFCLKDQKWKDMRTQFTPTLTSGKMKMMFDILVEVSEEFKSTIDEYATSGEVFEAKDVSGRFSTDVIGSIAFGIKCSCLKNRESPFWKYAQRVFNDTPLERIIVLTHHALPHKLLRLIKYKVTKPDVEKFFMDTVRNIVAHREKNKIYRNDFMQSLLKLKNAEKVTEQITDESEKLSQQPLTLAQIATQVFSFLVGGLETTSSTMTCALYELALNPKIQNELRNEINSVVSQHDNELTYAGVMEMKFMDQVLCETLRKYPSIPVIPRRCTKDYKIPQTNIILKKGTNVFIPLLGLHYDDEYYPDPEVFDPERFSEENKKTRPPLTWLAFGDGPRVCIGSRFGMLQAKMALMILLKHYKISVNKKTSFPIKFDKHVVTTSVQDGVWLNVEKLN